MPCEYWMQSQVHLPARTCQQNGVAIIHLGIAVTWLHLIFFWTCRGLILDRLKGCSFPGSCTGASWHIALCTCSMDYIRPLGYLCVIYTGVLPILMHLHWHHFWNTMTTTHIPSHKRRKGILSHCNRSTRCSQFPIINLQLLNWISASTSKTFNKFSCTPSP